ncbi:MAG: GTPase ObgE [Myxococcota bacterium]
MQFIDEATVVAASGAGGNGSRSFRREKHVPRGGPDGGDGGKGGDVVLVADPRSRSLLDYHYGRTYSAEDGKAGSGARKSGRDGEDLVLAVPPGTQVFDASSGELLADLLSEGHRLVILRGGNGGWGNIHFATATRQVPDFANPGQPALVRSLRFELKLLADVALVGYPNVGKSSLIRAISASQARVADYPFTTLVPNLGVVRHQSRVFTVADIPGLIEGAAQGAGLGTRFLKHVERCRTLVFLLSPVESESPAQQLAVLQRELASHDRDLPQRPSMVVLAKADLLGPDVDDVVRELAEELGRPVLAVSPITKVGVPRFLDELASRFAQEPRQAPATYDPMAD